MEYRQGVSVQVMRFKMLLAVVAVTTALLALQVSAAYAQSGSEGYSGPNVVPGLEPGGPSQPAGQVAPTQAETAPPEQTASPDETPVPATGAVRTAVDEGGTLPFTGTDFGVVTAAAGLLLALGFGLRRLTYRPTP
jgi:hypothetical protein